MSSQSPFRHEQTLTYGIEFEFMVAIPIAGRPDPHPQDERYTFPHATFNPNSPKTLARDQAQGYIVAMLKENGIPALSDVQLNVIDSNAEDSDWGNIKYLQEQAKMQGVKIQPGFVAPYAFWVVSEDPGITTIENQDVPGYKFVAMEVASQILKAPDFSEVERVYRLIQSNLRTQVNASCGLHIHVGIEHLVTELTNLKKLITLLMVLEDKGLFKQICAKHRNSNVWCLPVSRHSRAYMCGGVNSRELTNNYLVSHVPQLYGGMDTSLRQALTHVWNCTNIEDVEKETKVYGGSRSYNEDDTWHLRGGFAIRHLTVGPDIEGNCALGDTTIEFRYKESTGSAEKDRRWLELCLRFVRMAEWRARDYQALMWNLHQAQDLQGWLTSLGLERDEAQWWLRIAQNHRDQPMLPRNTRFLAPE